MFERTKLWLAKKRIKKLNDQLLVRFKEKDIEAVVHEVRIPCRDPFHYHTMPVIEAHRPPNQYNLFINQQVQWHGGNVVVQCFVGEGPQPNNDDEEVTVFTFPKDAYEKGMGHIVDRVVVDWLDYRAR